MTQLDHSPALALARRLRELRTRHWPELRITQAQLGEVLDVSEPSISSWEKAKAKPPADRLVAYAAFFATRRSVASRPYKLLPVDDLTAEERVHREELEHELLSLRDAASGTDSTSVAPANSPIGGSWWFDDGHPVTIVCSELPYDQRKRADGAADSTVAYGQLYSYGDVDSLLELHGHIRAANPTSRVFVRKASELKQGDYANHLVALGGVDWNKVTRDTLPRLSLPVRQVSPTDNPEDAHFEVDDGAADSKRFYAELGRGGELLSDVGLLVRAPNPFAPERTVTVCCAMYSLGVRGMVTALTDERLRDRNEGYLAKEFSGADTFFVLSKIPVVADKAVTPDWAQQDIILHRWSPMV